MPTDEVAEMFQAVREFSRRFQLPPMTSSLLLVPHRPTLAIPKNLHKHRPTNITSHHIEQTATGLDRPLYLRNKLYDKTLKSQNYYSNILRAVTDIYSFIRINCSFKNKKFKKKQRKKRHTTCQRTQHVKCILTMHSRRAR